MGRIAQNLVRTFLREARKIKRAAKGFTDGLPFDLPTVEELAKELHDPQHVLYVAGQHFASSGNVEERLRCKLSEAQRKIMAELCPDLSPRLRLAEKNQRSVELTRRELDRVLESARAALSEAQSFRKLTLHKVVQILANATPPQSDEQRTPRRASGQWVFEPAAGRAASARSSRKPRSSTATRQVYQFRVELRGTQPPIWRRIQVADCTLEALHLAIQGAMGWDVSHLYEFEIRGVRYTSRPPVDHPLGWDGDDDLDSEDAGSVRISELMPSNNRLQLRYVYDFGDSWEHVVKLEQILSATPGTRYPLCIDGARACPPEDCGGLYGYVDFVAAITDPRHEQHEEMLDWHGPYNPAAFDVSTATKTMRKFGRLGIS